HCLRPGCGILTMSCQYDNVLSVVALTPKGTIFRDVLTELFLLRAVMLDSAERLTAPVGLTSARWQILGAIEAAPAPVAHVARGLGLTRQAVQETADAMERDGLITFIDNPDHKRARLMSPTAKARTARRPLRARQRQVHHG